MAPTPQGRDRVETTEGGDVVLLTRLGRPWAPREAGGARTGSAVRWDGQVFEVVGAEARPQGGFRYVLRPWDDRNVIRSLDEYPGEEPAGAPPQARPAPAPAGVRAPDAARPRGAAALLRRIPPPLRPLLAGALPAVLLGWFLPFRILGEGISFFVHELGHTFVSWLFGRFAVPAVILTLTFDQSRLLAGLIWAALLYAAFRLRSVRGVRAAAFAVAGLYPVVAFTPLHVQAINLAGHAAEALVAAVFLFRAQRRGLVSDWELPVYGFLGAYLWARNVKLFFGVAFDAAARNEYLTVAITGENDLVKVAQAFHLDLALAAALTFLVCLAVPALGVVAGLRAAAHAADYDPGGGGPPATCPTRRESG
ncbi:MAG: hypothetical protein EDX89_15760 [Acidobacteria bacterium]|nr:MAG: hypothetical protein EDX89_15760 [Acidobacteriota bacterium]